MRVQSTASRRLAGRIGPHTRQRGGCCPAQTVRVPIAASGGEKKTGMNRRLASLGAASSLGRDLPFPGSSRCADRLSPRAACESALIPTHARRPMQPAPLDSLSLLPSGLGRPKCAVGATKSHPTHRRWTPAARPKSVQANPALRRRRAAPSQKGRRVSKGGLKGRLSRARPGRKTRQPSRSISRFSSGDEQ